MNEHEIEIEIVMYDSGHAVTADTTPVTAFPFNDDLALLNT